MNKRAGYAQPIIDFYAAIIIATIIVIFFIVLKLHSASIEVSIKGDVATIDGNMMLVNYVKAQIPYDGATVTIAEFIDLVNPTSFDKTLQDQLEKRTREYFRDYEDAAGCSPLIKITYDNDEIFLPGTSGTCELSASQRIPSLSGRQIIVSMEGKP